MNDEPNQLPAPDSANPSPGGTQGHPALVRTMGLAALVVYGVGDMIGAGVYGTMGKAAGTMGNAVWLSFLVSMVAALLTGLSYACIASRYPRAAGAAYVTQRAFNVAFLSYLVGLTTAASGLTSMATQSSTFAEFTHKFLGMPPWVVILAFLGVLTLVNLWGLRESMWLNLVCTTVEVGGLVFVVAVGARFWGGGLNYLEVPPPPGAADGATGHLTAPLLMSGAVLTFFAFVGFEDMLNVSEEVKNPKRTMPLGLMLAMLITTALYIAVAVTAVSVVPWSELAREGQGEPVPFAKIIDRAAGWMPKWVFTAITLFAVTNTALVNYIMGSRLLYGMSRQGLVPRPLATVGRWRRTPHVAILTMVLLVALLAVAGGISRKPTGGGGAGNAATTTAATDDSAGSGKEWVWTGEGVRQLAKSTSLLLLGVFSVVNVALIVLKFRRGEPRGSFEVPTVVPALGALVCLTLIGYQVLNPPTDQDRRAPLIAGAIAATIAVLYFVMRPKNVVADDEQPATHPPA